MKNKEITFYELMGLIKDSQAPKKIVYDNEIFIWNGSSYWSKFQEKNLMVYISTISDFDIPHLIIEILPEENDEWEDIEEINNSVDDTLFTMECYTGIPEKAQDWNFGVLKNKINQLIKNQKYLKEKLESKDVL